MFIVDRSTAFDNKDSSERSEKSVKLKFFLVNVTVCSKCVMNYKKLINFNLYLLLLYLFILNDNISPIDCYVFKLGYITGSQRRSGDMEYQKPGNWPFSIILILFFCSLSYVFPNNKNVIYDMMENILQIGRLNPIHEKMKHFSLERCL